jgi:hypothetical protein
MTRKNQAKVKAQASAGLDRARQAAAQTAPLAKTAGATAVQGVQDAREWAAPRIEQAAQALQETVAPRIEQGVNQARGWAAPRIGQAAHALQETVAPKVSEVLSATAQRIEPTTQAKRRMWPRLMAVLAVASAAGAAVAAIMRRRSARAADDLAMDDEMTQAAAEQEAAADGEAVLADAEASGNGKRTRA